MLGRRGRLRRVRGHGRARRRLVDVHRFGVRVVRPGLHEVLHDRRRLRPNIVIGGVRGLGEREWEGRHMRLGEVVIGIQKLRQRCIMTTFDPDTQEQDVEVLKSIHRKFGGSLALNCSVITAGWVNVGDAVELLS